MKLKKIVGAALLAAMSLSSVSAFAVNVPAPANNDEAYKYAEAFYHDGYYYEARQELGNVNPNEAYYDANKQAAWLAKVNAKIEELAYKADRAAIATIIADAKKLNSQLKFDEALSKIREADNYKITALEYEKLIWWENAITKNLNNPKYAKNAAAIKSGVAAIAAVEAAGYKLSSKYEHYWTCKSGDNYSVYVLTRTPNGTYSEVAAWFVPADGSAPVRAF